MLEGGDKTKKNSELGESAELGLGFHVLRRQPWLCNSLLFKANEHKKELVEQETEEKRVTGKRRGHVTTKRIGGERRANG